MFPGYDINLSNDDDLALEIWGIVRSRVSNKTFSAYRVLSMDQIEQTVYKQ